MLIPECRKCGYDLTGMPNDGKCPECGLPYNVRRRDGVRLPESPLEKSNRLYARARTIILTSIGTILLGVGIYSQFVLDHELAIYTVGFLGIMLLVGAAISYVSESDD